MNTTRTPAHIRLITHLLNNVGATISVDGEPFSTDRKAILADLDACGSADLTVDVDGQREWAQIICGLDPDETVADFSCGGVIDEWFEAQPC